MICEHAINTTNSKKLTVGGLILTSDSAEKVGGGG